jgi:hypothetical protein
MFEKIVSPRKDTPRSDETENTNELSTEEVDVISSSEKKKKGKIKIEFTGKNTNEIESVNIGDVIEIITESKFSNKIRCH